MRARSHNCRAERLGSSGFDLRCFAAAPVESPTYQHQERCSATYDHQMIYRTQPGQPSPSVPTIVLPATNRAPRKRQPNPSFARSAPRRPFILVVAELSETNAHHPLIWLICATQTRRCRSIEVNCPGLFADLGPLETARVAATYALQVGRCNANYQAWECRGVQRTQWGWDLVWTSNGILFVYTM